MEVLGKEFFKAILYGDTSISRYAGCDNYFIFLF
jgi:hypothetical protein